MREEDFSQTLPLMADHKHHNRNFPHWVYREQGANLWILEYAPAGLGVLHLPQGGTRLLQPGTFFLFQAGAYQNYGMDPVRKDWEHYYATFTPRDFWHEFLTWPTVYRGLMLLEIPDMKKRKELELLFARVVDGFAQHTQRREDFFLNAIETLLLELDLLNPLSATGRLDQRVRQAMEHIRNNFRAPLDVPALAREVNLSPSRFSHLFQRETGWTPMKYLEQQRLETARGLLAMTSATVEEIARQSGFSHAFYFSRQFRRAYGLSPRAYRQTNRAAATPESKKSSAQQLA